MKFITDIKNLTNSQDISGPNSNNIKIIEQLFNCKIELSLNEVSTDYQGNIDDLKNMFNILNYMVENSFLITERDIVYIYNNLNNLDKLHKIYSKREMITRNFNGLPIYPKTLRQIEYIKSLEDCDMTFGVGPAGTGKTYLAVVYAVSMLKKGEIKKIILTRPAIEAGESLGFLPGDLKEKIDPYLRPLYDALYDMLGLEHVNSLIEKGIIEIAPLAYMRGRTLENAFCILDEAQNTTEMQMKMFLTRMGFNSKMVITGDVSQIDLPNGKRSGLVNACYLLKNIKEIGIVNFEKEDVVRHPLVQKILNAYESENK
ncbi:MAG: PhoH family protein [Acholeplasmatales bacterium]|nr:PhoH family protein [Acholeplasmatales bacterium]